MKVLITGATGSIGGECLAQCLSHSSISSVVAFTRRDLPDHISSHPKLTSIVIRDFSNWPEDVLQAHSDATGMIWAMGSYNGSRDADLDYPLAFLQSMERMLRTKPARPPFRHVHLGGMFTCKDQDAKLWLLEGPRKLRGLAEARVIEFAGAHDSTWRAFVIRPGGVATERMTGSRTAVALMGQNWGIRVEELGAFMTYLVVDGAGEDSLIEHLRIVEKGKELRRLQKGTGAR